LVSVIAYWFTRVTFLDKKYKLKLNNKTSIINISKNSLDFLGFRFYIKNNKIIMKIRNKTKKSFKRKLKLIRLNKVQNPKQVMDSYKGHFKWGDCHNLLYQNMKTY